MHVLLIHIYTYLYYIRWRKLASPRPAAIWQAILSIFHSDILAARGDVNLWTAQGFNNLGVKQVMAAMAIFKSKHSC